MSTKLSVIPYIDGLTQDSSALKMEILQSYTKPSMSLLQSYIN